MRNNALAALVLGVCFIGGAAILATTWRGNVKVAQTLQVTGSAKIDLVSDLGRLQFSIQGRGTTAEDAWRDLQRQLPIVMRFLDGRGVPEAALETFPVNSWAIDEFDERGNRTGRIISYVSTQSFLVELSDVKLVKQLSLDLAGLVTESVAVETSMPEYLYLDLAAVKEEVQALAAEDAMRRAQKVAAAAGAKLGPIRDARMGVLQVTPRHSTVVSDYGVNDNSSIEKQITAVVHAKFAIE
ncbi:MAG TPA: SIMPL domain-containing protein [Candidatus Krumholzibacteria bacterium]|nr:SIMPL domain-containing protein [Candidatus Krumholzibacteria bacterium]HPD73167.1 SIMPL domain-containing protein [Candidatus Krumholzibacteria bacterium]HRY41955.1 SIMPL domain-containing protein [Candidatus Krumholzibacteria bacterium]